jgi:hypothetical protein
MSKLPPAGDWLYGVGAIAHYRYGRDDPSTRRRTRHLLSIGVLPTRSSAA